MGDELMPLIRSWAPSWWRLVLGLGLVWLVVGMAMMPAGVSFNPSHDYQASLLVFLYLPTLVMAYGYRLSLWKQLWRLPLFRVFLLLLGWAVLSLIWANLKHMGDEVGRLLSVLIFVLAWSLWDADSEEYVVHLLFVIGMVMAICAGYYSVRFVWHASVTERIAGTGLIATTNYAAALMGAVGVWLTQLPLRRRGWQWMRATALLMLLLFVALTQTRSIWLALGVCILLAPMWRPEQWVRGIAAAAWIGAALVALERPQILMRRGASLRPELMEQSLHLIAQQPWLGLGEGASFVLKVNGMDYTHTHNMWSQIGVELGLPGVFLLLLLWLLVVWQGWRHRDTVRGRLVLALWVYASVSLQFDMPYVLDSPRPGWLLVWLPFALALGLAWRSQADTQHKCLMITSSERSE